MEEKPILTLAQVEEAIESKISGLGWRIFYGFGLGFIGSLVGFGMLYQQVQEHDAIIKNGSTLTLKDKENLQTQINALGTSIEQLREDTQGDLADIKEDIRAIRNAIVR